MKGIASGVLCETDCIFVNTYIPPVTSRYSNIELFDCLENDLLSKLSMHSPFVIVGDFNSYTSTLDEYESQNDEEFSQFYNQETVFLPDRIPSRASLDDHNVNTYGRRLLLLCKNLNLIIVNGRFGRDRGVGNLTCKYGSIVDYVIISSPLTEIIEDFTIEPFDPLFSDVHSALSLFLKSHKKASIVQNSNVNRTSPDSVVDPRSRFIWDQSKTHIFRDNLCKNGIQSVLNIFDHSQQVDINHVAEAMSKLFISAADKTFERRKKTCERKLSNNRKRKKNNWFTKDCFLQQRKYRQHKTRFKHTQSPDDYRRLIGASKHYKKCIRKAKLDHQLSTASRLRTLSTKNPKAYWSILKGSSKKSNVEVPPIDDLVNHFREINSAPDDSEDEFLPFINTANSELDVKITEDEIKKAMKGLKSGKACGIDSITNEFIKCTSDVMMPVYCKLFNHVFDTGILPDSWLNGIIVPIYKNKGDPNDATNYRGLTILSCLGKVFTSILNNRLYSFSDSNRILLENQAGFRSGFSTLDHCFVLTALIELFLKRNKKLFCLMID